MLIGSTHATMTRPKLKTSLFLEAQILGLLANFTIWAIADLAKTWVLVGMGLSLGFFLLVAIPGGFSVLTNQFLNFVLLRQSLVNVSKFLDLCSFRVLILAWRRAHKNDWNCSPYTRKRPVLRTDSTDLILAPLTMCSRHSQPYVSLAILEFLSNKEELIIPPFTKDEFTWSRQ